MMIYRVRKYQHVTHGDVVQNNLHPDGTKFNIRVKRNVVIFIYKVRKDEHFTHSDVVQNKLPPDGTKFNIHVQIFGHNYIQSKKR